MRVRALSTKLYGFIKIELKYVFEVINRRNDEKSFLPLAHTVWLDFRSF